MCIRDSIVAMLSATAAMAIFIIKAEKLLFLPVANFFTMKNSKFKSFFNLYL